MIDMRLRTPPPAESKVCDSKWDQMCAELSESIDGRAWGDLCEESEDTGAAIYVENPPQSKKKGQKAKAAKRAPAKQKATHRGKKKKDRRARKRREAALRAEKKRAEEEAARKEAAAAAEAIKRAYARYLAFQWEWTAGVPGDILAKFPAGVVKIFTTDALSAVLCRYCLAIDNIEFDCNGEIVRVFCNGCRTRLSKLPHFACGCGGARYLDPMGAPSKKCRVCHRGRWRQN